MRGYVHKVVIACGTEVIARHPRSYEREDFMYQPARCEGRDWQQGTRNRADASRHFGDVAAGQRTVNRNPNDFSETARNPDKTPQQQGLPGVWRRTNFHYGPPLFLDQNWAT